MTKMQQQQDQVLEQIYKKQLQKQGLHATGTLDDSHLQVVEWLDKSDRLFPASVNEKIQHHAVQEFGLHQILKDKKALSRMTPSVGLLKQILAIQSELNPEMMQEVRKIIEQVVAELLAQLRPRFQNRLTGRINRHQSLPQGVMANLDWQKTVRQNLKYYDVEQQKLMIQKVYFHSRSQRHFPWRVILCIDQSGSMMESIIFSAVIAGILAKLPTVDLKLVLFDTNIIDLSDKAHEPVEVLLSAQMGGGTHIANAWKYCEGLAEQPQRTVVATVSDFCEGASPTQLLNQARGMLDAGIKMLGITALTAQALPFYDSNMTQRLATFGMDIASLSPDTFAQWLAATMEF